MLLIKSLKLGIWQITLAAHIRSTLFLSFLSLDVFLKLKKFEMTFNFFFFAILATFKEGSNPMIS